MRPTAEEVGEEQDPVGVTQAAAEALGSVVEVEGVTQKELAEVAGPLEPAELTEFMASPMAATEEVALLEQALRPACSRPAVAVFARVASLPELVISLEEKTSRPNSTLGSIW